MRLCISHLTEVDQVHARLSQHVVELLAWFCNTHNELHTFAMVSDKHLGQGGFDSGTWQVKREIRGEERASLFTFHSATPTIPLRVLVSILLSIRAPLPRPGPFQRVADCLFQQTKLQTSVDGF